MRGGWTRKGSQPRTVETAGDLVRAVAVEWTRVGGLQNEGRATPVALPCLPCLCCRYAANAAAAAKAC